MSNSEAGGSSLNFGVRDGGVIGTLTTLGVFLNLSPPKAETFADWTRLAFNALRGGLEDDPAIEYVPARHVEVQLRPAQPMQFDGEDDPKPRDRFTIEIVPAAVQVMVPKEGIKE